MKTKVYIIAVIKRDNAILMRKKPAGSPPYKQTWYMFHGVLEPGKAPEQSAIEAVRGQTGVDIRLDKRLGWNTEIKPDLDGETKQFVYLNTSFDYAGGDLAPGPGIEKLEWVPIDKLADYDLVPPSVELLTELGYLKD